MRLIDANAINVKQWFASSANRKRMSEALNASPTIDAVPVVRCKDCKHRNNPDVCHMIFMRGEMDWEKGAVSYTIDNYASDNDFCSKGEKRDGGTDNA